MSAISEKVRIALFDKMNVSGVTTLATGGIHYQAAPEALATNAGNESADETEFPFIVFRRLPADVMYSLGNTLISERDEWLIKALVDEDSSTTLEPAALAEDILTAVETAIGTTLTLTGNTVHRCRRVREMPDFIEQRSDRQVWNHGFYLEVWAD